MRIGAVSVLLCLRRVAPQADQRRIASRASTDLDRFVAVQATDQARRVMARSMGLVASSLRQLAAWSAWSSDPLDSTENKERKILLLVNDWLG
jgi:hypothetical protein